MKKCRTSLEAAEPVGEVRVGTPVISGAEAAVAVSYTFDGKEQRDGVTLVLVDGAWWLDTVEHRLEAGQPRAAEGRDVRELVDAGPLVVK